MSGPAIGELIFKATVPAVRSQASEIGIDILLAVLDEPEADPPSWLSPPEETDGSGSYAFYFNSEWKTLSPAAAAALAPFIELKTVDPNAVRSALLAAKQE